MVYIDTHKKLYTSKVYKHSYPLPLLTNVKPNPTITKREEIIDRGIMVNRENGKR